MKIVYTNHAIENIKERRIKREIIEKTIRSPDEIVIGKKGRKIAHKIINGKLLRVIYEPKEKAYILVTAYYTKLGRYIENENNL